MTIPLTTRTWIRRLRWLVILFTLLGLGYLAEACGGAKACGLEPSPFHAREIAAGLHVGEDLPERADPWALSPTGGHLDTGYGPGQERPGLLR